MTDRMKGPRWDNLLPEMKEKVLAILRDAAAAGLAIMFWSGWRSEAGQMENIQQGKSWVSDPLDSYHPWGAAVDLPFRNALGLPDWPDPAVPENMARWQKLGEIIRRNGLFWGGDFTSKFDGAHAQLRSVAPKTLKLVYDRDPLRFLRENGVNA